MKCESTNREPARVARFYSRHSHPHSPDSHRGTGFTLLEILLALGIVAIIATLSVTSLGNFNKDKALTIEVNKALSLLVRARSLTLAAKDDFVYGVHFEERKAVLFRGGNYNAGASGNHIQLLNDGVKISGIALTGGGVDVTFKKLSGATEQNGTLTLTAVRNPGQTKVITIAGTGIAYSN